MNSPSCTQRPVALLLLAALLAAGCAVAASTAHAGDVGEGTHFARKPTQPGTYFSERARAAVHRYYAAHPVAGQARWEIGKPLPPGEKTGPVPQGIARSLPRLPPGHRYRAVGGDILLIATGSGIVVDGISAAAR